MKNKTHHTQKKPQRGRRQGPESPAYAAICRRLGASLRQSIAKALLCTLAAIMTATAMQAAVRFHGQVTDTHNKPIEAASVQVEGTNYGTETDTEGRYVLQLTEAEGTVVLNFGMPGYASRQVSRKIASESYRINVTLKDSAYTLDGVEVTEYAKQTTGVQKLNTEVLRQAPGAGGGIENMLTTQAGVTQTNELSNQYSVRGGSYDENSVYVNHIEVYRPMLIRSAEQEGLSFVNPDLVDHIDFSTGGFGAEYGDKMSSVLDIGYRMPEAFEGSATVSLLGASAYAGAKTGPVTQIHGVRYRDNKFLLGSMDTEGEYKPRFLDYQTYITYTLSPKWRLDLLGNIARNKFRFVPESRKTKFGTMTDAKEFTVYFDGQEEDLYQSYFGNLALRYTPSKALELQLLASAYYDNENENYDIEGEYWLSDSQGDNTVQADMGRGTGAYLQHARNRLNCRIINIGHIGRRRWDSNTLGWGLTLQGEKVDEKVSEWEMRDSAGYAVPMNPDRLGAYYSLRGKNRLSSARLTAYIADSHTFRPEMGRIVVNGGLRANYWDVNQELLLSPRASAAFFPKAMPKWGFRLATGLYYQSPFYKELKDTTTNAGGYGAIGLNKDLKAQRSIHLLGGADYYFRVSNRPFKLSAEAYYKKLDDLVSYTADNVRLVYSGRNDAEGYIAGLDMKLFGEFVPGTDSWISLSLMRAKEDIEGDQKGKVSMPSEQRYNISMYFQDYIPGYEKFKFNLKLIWADGLPFGPPHTGPEKATFRAPAYRRVDIGASYAMLGGDKGLMQTRLLRQLRAITLGLDVLNLFDIMNVNSYYWVTDVSNTQYAVPNYLTGRQLNVRLTVDF